MSNLGIIISPDGDQLELHVTPSYLRDLANQLEKCARLDVEGTAVDLDDTVKVKFVDADVLYDEANPSSPSRVDIRNLAAGMSRPYILAIDVSGGMDPTRTQKWIDGKTVGGESYCREIVTFDLELHTYPDKKPTRAVHHSGGTTYRKLQEYVENHPDGPSVLVITDGFAEPIAPAHPDRWTWLITPDGHDWPAYAPRPMRVAHIQ